VGLWRSEGARQCWRSTCLIAILSLLLAGCSGGGDEPSPTAEATQVPTATPTPVPALTIGSVVWTTTVGDDGSPGEAIQALPRDAEVVYAVVQLQHVPAGTTVTGTWTMNGMPVEGREASESIEQETEAGWLAFSLTWHGETLWPTGTLGITVTASSGEQTSAEIQITS
jgi:hypothetical protein